MDIALILAILLGLIVALIAFKLLLVILPIAMVLLLTLIPLAITVLGLVSCMRSSKPGNTKLLWIIVIVLAPLLGPSLWFLWGKKNT